MCSEAFAPILCRLSFVHTTKLCTFCFAFYFAEYPCSGMLGMVSGLITDNQITASSHTDRSWVPENARLLTSRTGWTLLPQPQPFTNEWLQVDLGEEKLVKGLIIQGGKHRENKVFMKKFRLGYSNNGSDWRMVFDSSGNKPKVRAFLWTICWYAKISFTIVSEVKIWIVAKKESLLP